MADNGRWFKLWCSAVGDPDLDSLDIADFGRWAKLGAYIKEHGNDGEITIVEPARIIVSMLQVSSFQGLTEAVKRFKNVTVSHETVAPVSITIKYNNWFKYQGDFSTERVRKHRAEKRKNETPKKRREEKRGEENNTGSFQLASLMADLMIQNNPNNISLQNGKRESAIVRWSEDFDKLSRIDKRSWSEIEQVLRFSQADDFWKSNILSGATLRKQWDKLTAKMQQKTKTSPQSRDAAGRELKYV